ncbi:cupredoxin domain-containing protein [Snodgrassella sp. B3882]|uniref:cupredoxin domain-containing protein n=1 Tax=Snodgrassella sp. B3882 TaxID=2818037 RepID=UPI00226A1560|nr:cupredoxin domain-containing protein [Snodgrassella sp. B3882]MCX8744032.1 cupredoxin domain-containing protein [Snodgrassella sp. B3882]
MKKIIFAFLMLVSTLTSFSTLADDKVTLELKMKDGDMIPLVLNAPANKIIRIKVSNIGKGPVEFESTQLIKEKVLAPGASSVIVIAPKKPGTYIFFDDFHLNKPKGQLIVK